MTKCPICKTTILTDLVYHQGIYRCTRCSHLFRASANNFNYDFYAERDYWYTDPYWKRFMRTYFAFFEDLIRKGLTSIEIGAAKGDFLFWLSEMEARSGNLFPNIYYNELEDILGEEYQTLVPKERRLIGPAETLIYPCRFDNVFLIEVLEHFKDPWTIIETLANITSDLGRVFIATDNASHLNAVDMMFRHQEHHHIFSKKSLEILLQKSPFLLSEYWNSPIGKSYIVLERVCR